MTFGQTSGPPATAAQLRELLDLLARVGFDGFREARHPYGLSQRQSNGKFTRTEADELIARLSIEADGVDVSETEPPPADPRAAEPAPSVDAVVLAFPDEVLADELRRRGWACIPPEAGAAT